MNQSIANSLDGRTFTVSPGGPHAVLAGDLVVLISADGIEQLGQILQAGGADTEAHGVLLGAIGADGAPERSGRQAFRNGTAAPAAPQHLTALQAAAKASLPIGRWTSSGVEVAALLRAQGFGRHTFLCGQSGSGKTYALGVILEQILLGTELRMAVLDPNADFVSLATVRPDATPEEAAAIKAADIRVLGTGPTADRPLRARFATMPLAAQAAVLQLQPLVDRAEYNQFLHDMASLSSQDLGAVVTKLRSGDETGLAQRIENLGLLDWDVWAADQLSASEVLADGARLTVLDLTGFRDPHEPLVAALDLIENLWADREKRTPTLIVLDEAHNICPSEPRTPVEHALVNRLIQIAAEGRKYGLWLLLSTQRPSKIHPQVLSQCDNLALMRMNSPGDIAELTSVFGFAPADMLAASRFFVQGEALLAGTFIPTPSFVRMGARLTTEGGSDVGVPMS